MDALIGILCVSAGVAIGLLWRSRTDDNAIEESQEPAEPPPEPPPPRRPQDPLYALAAQLQSFYEATAHPSDVLKNDDFAAGVELLSGDDYSVTNLVGYFHGDSSLIACLALEALSCRGDATDDELDRIAGKVSGVAPWVRFFVFRLLESRPERNLLGPVLGQIDGDSWDWSIASELLKDFVRRRAGAESEPAFSATLPLPDSDTQRFVATLLDELGSSALHVAAAYRRWLAGHVNRDLLRSIGRLREPESTDDILRNDDFESMVREVLEVLTASDRRSIALVGEPGVGKSVLLRAVTGKLLEGGWVVFEADATDLLSGQSYMGELEQRLQELAAALADKPQLVWIVPDLPELVWAGRHRYGNRSVLDFILPYISSGRIQLIAEVPPDAFERMVAAMPRLRSAIDRVRLEPASAVETIELAKRWAQRHTGAGTTPILSAEVLGEARQLAMQYLGEKSPPGNLLEFLDLTRQWASNDAARSDAELTLDDLLHSLSRLTGLPQSMLDDREGLDVDSLRRHFNDSVMGQPEAIDCLVERVALIKAGLTDPTRPQGVFLFAGPTGTGKTEIAKTLTEFLFGSPERMIRLDMSEFQQIGSIDRILGDADDQRDQQALVNTIRKQPFSVVLLDEFEKAHENIWDLFLQVFDDGRLTDRRGRLADFRHAIIILTSNAGSQDLQGASLGFAGAGAEGNGTAAMPRSLATLFRPEFLNRLDRVVMFNPLSKAVMRQILHKELALVLDRRGLRNRQWAVEWDESAIEFLLERGFSLDMGARPLKRAIERYLLSPLAMTIVHHAAPAGDQFLFVRSDRTRIDVEFVDPDADPIDVVPAASHDGSEFALGHIAMDATGHRDEVAFLRESLSELCTVIESNEWRTSKQTAMDAMLDADFWSSDARFETLGRAENMDRLEAGIETATRLVRRIDGGDTPQRETFPADLVRSLAHKLYLLTAAHASLEAGSGWDALLRVELLSEDDSPDGRAFADRLGKMYESWAKRRRMKIESRDENRESGYRLTLNLSGYAAHAILAPEHGLHVLEQGSGKSIERLRVRVTVARDIGHPNEKPKQRRARVDAALADARDAPTTTQIVRRYREQGSPLVRDAVRNWKTGRADRVFAGDFDLI